MLWYEKYRPTEIDDYVWTDERTKDQLVKWIENPLDYPHLLLVGPTGTGKTTLAKIIRTALDLGADAKFIPASLRSGVDTIREEIVGFCEAGGFSDLKLIIMDEADRLSRDAQEMLRNVIDRYQDDVRFIFTCNNLDKIADPVQGRFWTMQIAALDEEEFIDRLIDIAVEEGIDLDGDEHSEARLLSIVDQNYPNMRKAISELQRSAVDGTLVDTGVVDTGDLKDALKGLFESGAVHGMREFVAGLRADQYLDVYRCLYEHADYLFSNEQEEAILVIAEHLYRHALAGLPDITLVACLIKLSNTS